jgi:hypothetical protein
MRCTKIFIDLRSLSLHRPTIPSVVMVRRLREAQTYPLVFRAFSQGPRAQAIGADRRQELFILGLTNNNRTRVTSQSRRPWTSGHRPHLGGELKLLAEC